MSETTAPKKYNSAGNDSRPQSGRPGGRGGFYGKRRPAPRRRVCRVCADHNGFVDWKQLSLLQFYVTSQGKILPGRSTATCSECQRKLTKAIKMAQSMALLPVSSF